MKKLFLILLISAFAFPAFSQKQESFQSLNKKNRYTSFSFGMGVGYGNNKSLNTFIGYELPNYPLIPESQKLSEFQSGFDFFGGVEKQLHKNFSLKLGYSYYIKSLKVDNYSNATFDYNNHMLMLQANYIIPYDYIFFKVGAGVGGLLSKFNENSGYRTGEWTSNGMAVKLDATIDLQISKNMAIMLNGYIMNTFNSDLKDSDGKELKNAVNENVNLNSLSLGLRIGLEIFIF